MAAALAIVVVVIIVVASVVAFYALSSKSSSTASSRLSTTGASISTTSGKSTSAVSRTSTSSTGATYYSGSFNYTIPVGPSGVRSLANGTTQYYNSTQVDSGTFTFSIAAGGLSGTGTGQGTFTITTKGFCTGSQTIHYTFAIPDVTTILGNNLTIFFGGPSPANYTVPLTCTGNMAGVSTATNNPGPYLAEYPGEIDVPLASLPASETFQGTPAAFFTWGYSIKETG